MGAQIAAAVKRKSCVSNKINTPLQQHRLSMSYLKLSQIQVDIFYIVTT